MPGSAICRVAVIPVILDFLRNLPLLIVEGPVSDDAFLPGIEVCAGGLRVDVSRLTYPGDLLHEAGHLAVLGPKERSEASAQLVTDGGYEMAAIAWSYAACVHLGLPLEVLFHDDGYKGGARALRDNFVAGRYVGVPMLVWLGLTTDDPPESGGYPRMHRWLVAETPPTLGASGAE